MKLIAVYTKEGITESKEKAGMMVWPDSAFIRSGKPLFIPDGENWNIFLTPCLRIDRLGKSIEPKFASRYYHEVAPMAVVLPERAARTIENGDDPLATDIVADCSIVCGDFIPKDETSGCDCMDIRIENLSDPGKKILKQVDMKNFREDAVKAICFASRNNTLKTGDILAPAMDKESIKAEYNLLVVVSIAGKELLKFKVK